jgi:hypothetical protein
MTTSSIEVVSWDAHAERAARHADILILLVDKETGPLGLATIMGEPHTAVAVVDHRDSVWYLTIAHEIGHIMGALHDVADDDTEYPYSFGHGFVGPVSRTIMSTPCATSDCPCDAGSKCPLVLRWSGVGLGEPLTSDNVRVLRLTGITVAAFGERL